jgi:hypothetical protein
MDKKAIGFLVAGVVIGLVFALVYKGSCPGTSPTPIEPVPPAKESAAESVNVGMGITFPLADFPVSSPVTVAGVVSGVFENQFMISVLDANGKELGQVRATAYGDIGKPAVFSEEVTFAAPTTKTGTIEIWDQSAKDGSKQVIDSVKIQFY